MTDHPPRPKPESAEPGSSLDFLTKRPIGHDEARECLKRFIASAFRKNGEEHARLGIPARPDYDDDLVLSAYIRQQSLRDPAQQAQQVDERADMQTIVSGLLPAGMDIESLTPEGRDEVRQALDTILKVWDRTQARLALALGQLDKAADHIAAISPQDGTL